MDLNLKEEEDEEILPYSVTNITNTESIQAAIFIQPSSSVF